MRGGPDELVPGWGGSHRDGLGVRADRGGVEIAVIGGLILDPVLGVRRAALGIRDGRICAIGRAGNPDTMDGIDVVLDAQTAIVDARGMIVTPGVVDSHVHWLSPQVARDGARGLGDDGRRAGLGADLEPRREPGRGAARGLGGDGGGADQRRLPGARLVVAARGRRGVAAGGRQRAQDPRGRRRGARPAAHCALGVADRQDVQLAIHTDGLNEALSAEDTARVLEGHTVHLYHIEGVGGGHAPTS